MVRRELIERLRCTICGESDLRIGADRRPALHCSDCGATFPVVDGIPDMIPPQDAGRPGSYRTDTLQEAIAGVYDFAAPVMSLGLWHCSPIRYVDVEHRAIGRANPGVYLKAPIGTGAILDRVLAPYHDVCVIGVDSSWKMLRKAKKRLADASDRVHLVRGRLDDLPLTVGSVDSVHSPNGIHTVTDRISAFSEFDRVVRDGGFVSGTALIRGQELLADAVLDRYERWGVLPMTRTAEFLVGEMERSGLSDVRFETHGAVLFFTASSS